MSQTMLTIALPLALAWVMYCVGLTLTVNDFKRVALYPRKITAALAAQLIGLPLLAYLLIQLFSLPEPIAAGLWLLAIAPGDASSNAISHLSGGDSALSITITAVSSLIIPFSLPLMLPLIIDSSSFVMPVKTAVLQLAAVTIMPLGIAMTMRRYITASWFAGFRSFAESSALWALFFTVVVTLAANSKIFNQLFTIASTAAVLLCLSGMLLGLTVAKLLGGDKRLIKTLSIEVGIQNAGTAIFAAVVLLQKPELALTPLLYGILMNIPAMLLIYRNKRRTALLKDFSQE
ncbi:bile acid:sodium symporter family protein [Psychromonas aquimarina]|uniref:bile acid:sodium symporter family protein n=1 Tax=Psychromonas aquimarina TaxID=444919 RepID=UPI00040548F5|nr:bile acid:sodium symporter family protein [Psychromonas aquimarina]